MRMFGIPLCIAITMAGCGKRSLSTPVLTPLVEQWEKGDKSGMIRRFVDTDWTAGPLFAPDSVFSMSENQFMRLRSEESVAMSKEILPQIVTLRQIAQGVIEAGKGASGKGDSAGAKKHFNAVKQYGVALDNKDTLLIVQQVGKAFVKLADAELAKVNP